MDHAITRSTQVEPIEGFVPLDEPVRKKPGRKKGTPNKPKVIAVAEDTLTPMPAEDRCPACNQRVVEMTLDLARELVRASRDKILESQGEVMSAISLADTLYLAARFDGFCSLACWRKKRSEG